MKRYLAVIISAALMMSMTSCSTDTNSGSGNGAGSSDNGAGGIFGGLGEIGEKVGEALGIGSPEKEEEKIPQNPLFKEGLLAVKVDVKWGYIDESGSFAIEPQFLDAENFQSNGLAAVSEKWVDVDGDTRELYGLIDKSGNYVVEPAFWSIENFQSNGLAIVWGKYSENEDIYSGYGVIDESGNYVIKPKYDKIEDFASNGIAKIAENMRVETYYTGLSDYVYDWGLVNEKGEIIVEPEYAMITNFDSFGYARIGVDPWIKQTYISDGMWSEETVYNCGLINEKGETIIEISKLNYGIGDFHNGWALVNTFPECNYIDKDGNYLIDYSNTKFGFDFLTDAEDFLPNGLAKVTVGDFYIKGFIDTNGDCPVEIKYYDLGDFADGELTYAYIFGEKYGFIDKNGNYVIEPQFDKAEDFDDNGYAKVNIGYTFDTVEGTLEKGKWGLIDKSGNYVVQPVYDKITEIKNDVAIVQSGDKFGFVNLKKNIVVEPVYQSLSFYDDKYITYYDSSLKESVYMDYDGNIDSDAKNRVYINGHCIGYTGSNGNVQIDKQLLSDKDFTDGFEIYNHNGEYGLIYPDGNVILFDDVISVSDFSRSGIAYVAVVENNSYIYGYVNKNGDYVAEPQYERATRFYDDNYAVVFKDGEYEIINENGQNAFGQKFDSVVTSPQDYVITDGI